MRSLSNIAPDVSACQTGKAILSAAQAPDYVLFANDKT
jgi:hypothetical protein